MNNEDKIIDLLTTLTSDMYIVKASVSKLEAGQAEMRADINELKEGQVNLEAGQAGLKSRIEDIHNTLAKLENENEQTHGAIFDKLDVLENKQDVIAEDVSAIRERVDAGELYIRVFNKKLNQV